MVQEKQTICESEQPTVIPASTQSALFVSPSDESSKLLNSPRIAKHFIVFIYTVDTVDGLFLFLNHYRLRQHCHLNAGYPTLLKIGGLTRAIIEHEYSPKESLE